MSASPTPTAVTSPPGVTAATDPFEDCQPARFVTVWLVPFDRLAVAENCAVLPMDGASPVTVTAVRVGAAVGAGVGVGAVTDAGVPLLPPHAHRPTASKPALANEAIHRRMRTRLPGAARTGLGVKTSELILRNQRAGDDPKAHRQQFSHTLSPDSDIKRASCTTVAQICCAEAVKHATIMKFAP